MCKCTAASWAAIAAHNHMRLCALIYSICYHCSLPVCHCGFPSHTVRELYNSASGQRLSMCFLLFTHLKPPWWAAVRNSFAWRGWLMMFLGKVSPPTAESRTHNWGGVIDRLRSWKFQTKGLYGNVCRIKTLHSCQSSLLIITERVSRQEERKHEKMSFWLMKKSRWGPGSMHNFSEW